MARECRCSCDTFSLVIRVGTVLSFLSAMGLAGWGFLLANARLSQFACTGCTTPLAALNSLQSNYGVFQGLMSAYFILFGFMGIVAEIRTKILQSTILSHVSLLTTYPGRALLCIYVGSMYLVVPWDDARPWASQAVGGLLTGFGVLQLLFYVFVAKKEKRGPMSASAVIANPMHPNASGTGQPSTEGAKIAWGQPTSENEEAVSVAVPSPEGNGIAHTQSRQYLLSGAGPSGGSGVMNPIHPNVMASFAPTPTDSITSAPVSGETNGIAKNPFMVPE